MTLWAVGDIQGCADAFDALLDALAMEHAADKLWLVGDFVNRGPDSLGALRRIVALGDRVTAVLGNHDLHLLAHIAGARGASPADTFGDVLAAPDRDTLLDWLRQQPLLHCDRARNRALVHAGIPPTWTLATAVERAAEIEERLAGPGWKRELRALYGGGGGAGTARRRETLAGLTRIRYCDAQGLPDFEYSGPPGTQPAHLMPWFDWPGRPARETHIVFGHWAALGLVRRADVTATDTGCVWGGRLTAVPLDTDGEPVSIACEAAASPRGASRART